MHVDFDFAVGPTGFTVAAGLSRPVRCKGDPVPATPMALAHAFLQLRPVGSARFERGDPERDYDVMGGTFKDGARPVAFVICHDLSNGSLLHKEISSRDAGLPRWHPPSINYRKVVARLQ
jgi:hypothetical protein